MAISKRTKIGGAIGAAVLAVTATVSTLLLTGPTNVPEGGNLQEYINRASTGDVLQLAASTYICNCVDNKGLTIQGSGPATVIKAPDTDPASPTIYYPPKTPPAILRNLTVSSATIATKQVYDVVRYGDHWGANQDAFDEQPQGLTMENVVVTCQPTQECQRGIAANGRNVVIRNVTVREVHGRGYDTQGIAAWNGTGPFSITDSHIEAAGENILFGGADASIPNLIPTGIEIRRTRLFKPLSWKVGHPTYAGIHWTVKNLLELKMAKDVVIDGNILENCWADAQIGFGVLFTVRNQDGGNPWAVIQNVTYTNNTMINVAGGFQLLGKDYLHPSAQSSGLRIANNVTLLAPAGTMGFNGRLLQLQQYDNVVFENNESNPPHSFLLLTGTNPDRTRLPSAGLIFRNNFLATGEYGLLTDDALPIETFAPGAVVTGNVIYPKTLPYAGNTYLPAKPDTVPAGVGVDYAALQAAQRGPVSSPTATPTATATTPAPSPSPSPSPSATSTPVASPTATSSPLTPSPNNTRIPTASRIVDNAGAAWTLSGTAMLRNGQPTGGFGSALLWCNGLIYGKGEDFAWWKFDNGWGRYGPDPCGEASPSPTATATPAPTATPTPVPTSTPAPSPVSSPSPLRFCASGERPGNPPVCRCLRGTQGSSGKCR